MLGAGMGLLPEREQVIGYLERGTAIQKFCYKSKPEKKTMLVRRETMLIVWQRALSGKNSFDGSIDIREIKEVRRGKKLKGLRQVERRDWQLGE